MRFLTSQEGLYVDLTGSVNPLKLYISCYVQIYVCYKNGMGSYISNLELKLWTLNLALDFLVARVKSFFFLI